MIKKYLQDVLSTTAKHILGGHSYTDWATKNLDLRTNIPIKNTALAKELEKACEKNGFLTYAEFLAIDQFGKYGYHNSHKQHGMTDVKFRWPEALAVLCKQKGLHHIVEFGPGDGVVGIKTLKEAKKIHHELSWSGVEISKALQEKTKKLFHKNKLDKQLTQLVSSLNELFLKDPCLFVFSYSLDNLIPDVFVNTSGKTGIPNAMVGVKMNNGLLSEALLSEKELRLVGCSLKNGIFTDQFDFSWDLSQWQLNPMQRLYVPLEAYRTLFQAAQLLPKGSQILIIDEFRITDNRQSPTYHVGLPRDLETFSRDFSDFEKLYRSAGSNLLYFPMFLDTTTSFLTQLGFGFEENTGEHALANKLAERNNPIPRHPHTIALLTTQRKRGVMKKIFNL